MAQVRLGVFRYGAFEYGAVPVWRRCNTAHFSMAQFRGGASKRRPKRAVPRATCHLYHQNKLFQLHQLNN